MALDALTIDWCNPQLLEILSNTKPDAHLLWQEHVPTACAKTLADLGLDYLGVVVPAVGSLASGWC